jgi:PEP-CTERM motif
MMFPGRRIAAAMVTAVTASFASIAWAGPNLVADGGFEAGSTVATNPPWTVTDFLGSFGEGIDYGIDTSPADAQSGSNSFYGMGFNDGFDPVIPTVLSQTLSTQPGHVYNVSLGFANFAGGLGELEVLWGGNVIYDNPNIGPQGYTNILLHPIAAGASTILSIELSDSGGFPLNVDNVSVPEPATWATLLLGLAGMGFVRRRIG